MMLWVRAQNLFVNIMMEDCGVGAEKYESSFILLWAPIRQGKPRMMDVVVVLH